jgi:MSHA biogenesis protein MshM
MQAMMECFKLREKPFSLTPDLDFFCDFSQYGALVSKLKANAINGEGLVVVTAEIGLGKTMACRKLLQTLDDVDHIETLYIPNPKLEPAALLSNIAEQLLIDTSSVDAAHLTNAINLRLIELAQQRKQVICVIDEAQVMGAETLETLRLLTNLETNKRKLIQIFLFGQPELMNILERESLRQIKQRISYIYTIKPLSFSECYQYVCRRLVMAGHPDGIVLTKTAHYNLYKFSRGVPRVVNLILDKALTIAAESGKTQITAEVIKKAMAQSPNLEKKTASRFDELLLIFIIVAIAMLSVILLYRVMGDI